MHTLIAAASALIAAATGSGGLQLPSDGPATFDVAGVKLNMTPDEARAALVRAGYRITHTTPATSFAQQAALGARKRTERLFVDNTKPASVGGLEAVGPHGEGLGVQFIDLRSGPRAWKIGWMLSGDKQDSATFMQQVQQRFGKPGLHPNALEGMWCSPEERCTLLPPPVLPTLRADALVQNSLTLDVGPQAVHAVQVDLDAEIDRLAPKTQRSAF